MKNPNDFKKGRHTKYSNKIGLYSNSKGGFIKNDTEVVLSFPFKDTILEAGMSKEDMGREERFLHLELDSKDIDTLEEPKVLTDFRYVDKNGEKSLTAESDIDFFDAGGNLKHNLLIKGNNLLALYTLRERLVEKVKLIYIDPPYNTKGDANSFAYNNTFNHSSWLTFMKNRLEIARELLKDDGYVAITIDHNELFYLGVLADEIFGRDNRIGVVSIVIRPQGRQFERFFSTTTEYMLVYAKNIALAEFNGVVLDQERQDEYTEKDEKGTFKWEPLMYSRFVEEKLARAPEKYFYPIYVSQNLKIISLKKEDDYFEVFPINKKRKICWRVQKDKFADLLKENPNEYGALKDKEGTLQIFEKYREESGNKIKNHWIGKRYNATTSGTGVLKEIFGEKVFSYPKALYAVLDTIKIMTKKDDIVLDFFAGSGTTAHAVLALNEEDGGNRKFILVEQMDYIDNVTKERLKRVINSDYINNSFVFLALKQYNQEYVERIMKATTLTQLEDLYVDMRNNAFLKFWFDRKEFEKDENFRKLDIDERKQKLVDVLDENQLYLNYADMGDTRHSVTVDEKALTDKFYDSTKN